MKNKVVLLLLTGLALVLSSCSSGLSAEEVKDGIRKFAYDERIACQKSFEACFLHKNANRYPILKLSAADIKELKEGYWEASPSPDLETIEKDDSWLYPGLACEKENGWVSDEDIAKPLPGETYTVEAGSGDNKYSYHMTYLDGKWHDYPVLCN